MIDNNIIDDHNQLYCKYIKIINQIDVMKDYENKENAFNDA